jgi:hypothetical protein
MKAKGGRKRLFNQVQHDFLCANIESNTNAEMGGLLFERFGLVVTKVQIKTYLSNHNIITNKNTRFKKGRKPHNLMPCGAKYIIKGYWNIKIGFPDLWQKYHHYVWEQHYEPIKEGEVIYFTDGDKDNVTIGNLALLSRALMLHLLRNGHTELDIELKPLSINIAKLEMTRNNKTKEKQK